MTSDNRFPPGSIKNIRTGLTLLLVGFIILGISALMRGETFSVIGMFIAVVGISSVRGAFKKERDQEIISEQSFQRTTLPNQPLQPSYYEVKKEEAEILPQEPARPEIEETPASLPVEQKPSWSESIDWEEWVGQKLLQKLGVVIVLIGMAVFLKYSFDNGWIGPHGRIAMSMLASCALLFAGEFFQKKYPQWFQAFTGGGLALLYFTVWAAHVFYAGRLAFEVTPLLASILYGAITLIGALAAIRYRAQTVAWFTVAGGYITPLLIAGVSDPMGLILYLAILASGLLVLAWHQKWRYLNIAAFVFTQLYLVGKIYPLSPEIFTDPQQVVVAIGFFLLFGLLPFLYQFRLGIKTEVDDILLTIGNGLAVFFPVVYAMGGIAGEYTSFVCLALAAIYIGYAAMALNKVSKDDLLVNTYLIGAVILVALALWIELETEWVAAGWAPFSALLVSIAVYLKRTGPWRCALILLGGSIFFLGTQTPGIVPMGSESLFQPFTSAWSIQSYIVFASLVFWITQSRKLPQNVASNEFRKSTGTALHIVMAVILFAFLSLNALAIGVPTIDWTIDITLTMAQLLFIAIAMLVFFFTRELVWFVGACLAQAFVLLSIFIFAEGSGMLAYTASSVATPLIHPWAGVSVASLLITIGLFYISISRSDTRINAQTMRTLLIGVALAQVWIHVSVEIHHLAQALLWSEIVFLRVLGGWWIVFAVAVRQWGFLRGSQKIADIGIALLLLPLLKDIGGVVNGHRELYEVLQWIIVPLALTIQSAELKKDASAWLIGMLGLYALADMLGGGYVELSHTMVWTVGALATIGVGMRWKIDAAVRGGSVILGGIAGIDMLSHFSAGGQSLLRTTWWAMIALVTIGLGFAAKEQLLRKVGIGLFFATAIKLLVFDFAVLSTGIRIAASIATGLLMIGASYLYQRFGEVSPAAKSRHTS